MNLPSTQAQGVGLGPREEEKMKETSVFAQVVPFAVMCVLFSLAVAAPPDAANWAEKLGWEATDRVLMIHSDDVGMCHEANRGAIEALEQGVVNSISIMMPCPWVGEIAAYLEENPEVDAGLHLTLCSERSHYRWGPVAGQSAVPSLVDEWGCLWRNNGLLQKHATAEDVETEIRAQIARAHAFGIQPTHMDTHMGSLFVRPDIAMRYAKVGVEMGIPIMAIDLSMERVLEETKDMPEALRQVFQEAFRQLIKTVWDGGLPIVDNLVPADYGTSPENKKAEYVELLRTLPAGINILIVHCAIDTPNWRAITEAAPRWIADYEVMLDPELKRIIEEEGIIMTTWRELKARRDAIGKETE